MAAKMAPNSPASPFPAFDLPAVAAKFSIDGTYASGRPYGSGHIHDTFLIETGEKGCPDYILQRINTHVFADVPRLMENIVRVTEHLRNKIGGLSGSDHEKEVLTVVPGRDGRPFYMDGDGACWRCFVFIEHREPGDRLESPGQACEAGRIFGRFIDRLADLPGPPLHETIPAFHDIECHLMKFAEILETDPQQRAGEAAGEIDWVRERAGEMKRVLLLGRAGRIPLRTIHNDTKFNNILFDRRGKGLCIIDLDTVMPGYVHYDFGDAVRSGCNRAGEDAPDLNAVGIDLDLFKAFAEGFLAPLRAALNECEMTHLAFAAKQFAFQVGLRFLSDHLAGDGYFKVAYPGHNLRRARVQFRLLESMEKRFAEMEDIVGALAGKGPEKC